MMVKYLSRADCVPDGFTSNLVRYPAGTILYLPLLIHAACRGGLGRFWLAALIPTAVNIAGQTLWAWAFFHLDAGVIAFLIRLCVVFSILAAFLLFPDERSLARSPLFWAGAAMSFSGFIIMSTPGLLSASGATLVGIVIMFGCSVLWGMYGVSIRYVMGNVNPLVVFAIVGNYTSAGLILMAPLGEPASVLRLSPVSVFLLVASALTGITAAHGLYYIAVRRIGVAISDLTLTATPFVSLIASALLLGERFGPVQWAGGLILVAGSGLALRSQHRLAHPPVPDPHDLGTE